MLTNKQKAYLRSIANREKAVYHIGKEGINTNLIDGIDLYLAAHELIKVNLLKTAMISANEAAIDISIHTGSDVVQIIGRTIILYRKSKKGVIVLP